jgi:hypothetical protein
LRAEPSTRAHGRRDSIRARDRRIGESSAEFRSGDHSNTLLPPLGKTKRNTEVDKHLAREAGPARRDYRLNSRSTDVPKKEADMELFATIDLHSNNSVVVVIDSEDRLVFGKRLPNNIGAIVAALHKCEGTLIGVAVESTYNWYWLVDGLRDAGFSVHPQLHPVQAVCVPSFT